jgi:hypothetical protein
MKTLLIAVSALALATPALAQMEPAMPGATTNQSTTTTTQTPATPPSDPATPTTETTSTTTTTPSDPKALIASEFPAYDKDSNGTLNKSEFATWIGALKEKADGRPTPPAELTKFADGAFATADTDKSKTVTLAELQTYLTAKA